MTDFVSNNFMNENLNNLRNDLAYKNTRLELLFKAVKLKTEIISRASAGNTEGGSITTVDLFDSFGLVCFANKNIKLSVVLQLIPNQSNRRSMVQ
jgi:hypothetical protein